MIIQVSIDMADMKETLKALDVARDKSKVILRKAINDTATHMNKFMYQQAKDDYHMKASQIKSAQSIKKATTSSLTATVTSKSPIDPLYDFKVQPKTTSLKPWERPKAGHKGGTLKGTKLHRIYLRPAAGRDKYKAFYTRVGSGGHQDLFQRIPGSQTLRHYTNPKTGKNYSWIGESIRTVPGLSVPKMMGYGNETKAGVLQEETRKKLQESMLISLDRFLSGEGGSRYI